MSGQIVNRSPVYGEDSWENANTAMKA